MTSPADRIDAIKTRFEAWSDEEGPAWGEVVGIIEELLSLATAATKRVEELEEAARWRPITETPPAEDLYEEWRVVDDEGFMDEGMWRPDTGWTDEGVTHWRPLSRGPGA